MAQIIVGSDGILRYIAADGEFAEVKPGAPLPVDSARLAEFMARVEDTLERIQQQLATMNEGDNMVPGDRRYR